MSQITVDEGDLRRLLGLWDACEAAERHYHSCQSAQFRSFVKSVWDAPNMHRARERLEGAANTKTGETELSAAAGEDQPKNSAADDGSRAGKGEEDGT